MDEAPEEKHTTGSSTEHFTTSTLPLFHGPLVKIRIEPSNREYTVSKTLLCNESPVFSAMFKGNFRESQEETATLQEMDGVVSIQSIEALLQWLYLRTIHFDIDNEFHERHIVAAVELARLAEMYGFTEIESQITRYIKSSDATFKDPITGKRRYLVKREEDEDYDEDEEDEEDDEDEEENEEDDE
ncbi:hypothetical protein N7489_004405 [Penicillium chrysogenum]|uniref:uncharacterized protein n=1 Tax=Penicillium chrysogenum TaxID=5076 RepID=UPI0024DF103F|nr:uncharacterized protein N7489_004405 [Penicillium chrysogenum]KAJ5244309.1 hypothetical protein N7489_004405 [Penicillium chrysogenum]